MSLHQHQNQEGTVYEQNLQQEPILQNQGEIEPQINNKDIQNDHEEVYAQTIISHGEEQSTQQNNVEGFSQRQPQIQQKNEISQPISNIEQPQQNKQEVHNQPLEIQKRQAQSLKVQQQSNNISQNIVEIVAEQTTQKVEVTQTKIQVKNSNEFQVITGSNQTAVVEVQQQNNQNTNNIFLSINQQQVVEVETTIEVNQEKQNLVHLNQPENHQNQLQNHPHHQQIHQNQPQNNLVQPQNNSAQPQVAAQQTQVIQQPVVVKQQRNVRQVSIDQSQKFQSVVLEFQLPKQPQAQHTEVVMQHTPNNQVVHETQVLKQEPKQESNQYQLEQKVQTHIQVHQNNEVIQHQQTIQAKQESQQKVQSIQKHQQTSQNVQAHVDVDKTDSLDGRVFDMNKPIDGFISQQKKIEKQEPIFRLVQSQEILNQNQQVPVYESIQIQKVPQQQKIKISQSLSFSDLNYSIEVAASQQHHNQIARESVQQQQDQLDEKINEQVVNVVQQHQQHHEQIAEVLIVSQPIELVQSHPIEIVHASLPSSYSSPNQHEVVVQKSQPIEILAQGSKDHQNSIQNQVIQQKQEQIQEKRQEVPQKLSQQIQENHKEVPQKQQQVQQHQLASQKVQVHQEKVLIIQQSNQIAHKELPNDSEELRDDSQELLQKSNTQIDVQLKQEVPIDQILKKSKDNKPLVQRVALSLVVGVITGGFSFLAKKNQLISAAAAGVAAVITYVVSS